MRIFCTLRISWNRISDWLSIVFHFGTENWADQLKKPPCMWQLVMGGQKVRTGPFHRRPPATALWRACWRWLERTAPHNSPPGWSWSAQVSAWPSSFIHLLRAQMDKEEKLGIDFKSFKLHRCRLHSDGREIRRSGRKRSPLRSSEYFFFSRSFYVELQVFARAGWRQGTE